MKRIIKGIKEKPIGFSMNLFIFEQITKSKTAEIIVESYDFVDQAK